MGVAINYFKIFNILEFVRNNYLQALTFVSLYVFIGVIWSFIKWICFLLEFKRIINELKNKYPNCSSEEIIKNNYSVIDKFGIRNGKPKTAENKARIIAWMSFWPMSVISTLLNDPIRRLFIFIYNSFSGLYQKISDKILKNV
jgi:hypothetical protein